MLEAMSDAEVIAAGKRVTRAAADLLLRHGLTDAERAAGAAERIGRGDITGALIHLIGNDATGEPGRLVFYDAERIYGEGDLIETLREHAAATLGEWEPEEVSVDVSRGWASIGLAFTYRGRRHEWRYNQHSDYVYDGFYEHLDEFAAEELTGRFVQLATNDQCYCGVYLPEAVAGELTRLLLSLPGPEGHGAGERFWQFYRRYDAADRRARAAGG